MSEDPGRADAEYNAGWDSSGGAVGAVVLAVVSTIFHSFSTVFVYWLGHLKGDGAAAAAPPPTPWGVGNTTTDDQYSFKPLTAAQVMFWQCLLEGIFMSGVVGVPTMLAYLARKAEDSRADSAAASLLHELQEAQSDVDDDDEEVSSKRRGSIDTLTSNELKGILVNDAWCEVDDDMISGASRQYRKRVTFNQRIQYDPPPPPPIPLEEVTSRLKRETRPGHIQATRAYIAAALLISSTSVRHLINERKRTPMPIQLPPKRAACLCAIYGLARAISVYGNYLGLVSDMGLCSTAILFATTPAFSTVLRVVFLGESLTVSHLPGVLFMVVGSVLVVATTSTTSLVVIVLGGFAAAVAHFFHNVIRTQVHPCFIAVSMAVFGAVGCGIASVAGGHESPSGEQWGYIMGLCICCLVSDTTQAASAPESPHVPAGFARALAIALALGLQTVVIDQPPVSSTSLAAICTFSATILLEVKRMATEHQPYLPLSSAVDEPPELPDTPPQPPRPPTPPPPPPVRRSGRVLEV